MTFQVGDYIKAQDGSIFEVIEIEPKFGGTMVYRGDSFGNIGISYDLKIPGEHWWEIAEQWQNQQDIKKLLKVNE